MKTKFAPLATALALAALSISTAHAQLRTWVSGNGNYDDATKWNPADVPDTSAESADTNTTNSNVIAFNVDGITIDGLTVHSGDTLNFGTAAFGGSTNLNLTVATNLTNDGTVNIFSGNTNSRDRSITYQGTAFNNTGTILLRSVVSSRGALLNLTGASGTHTNSGTIIVNGDVGAGKAQFNMNASGSVFINSGTVTILNGGSNNVFSLTGNEYRQTAGVTTVDETVNTVANSALLNAGSAGSVNINGGKLEGHGRITGTTTLNSNLGGKIAPGSSTTAQGTLTLTGTSALTWNSGNTEAGMLFNLSAVDTTSDLLAIGGVFTKGSGTSFLFDFTGGVVGNTYTLLTFASSDFASLDFGTAPSSSATGTFTKNATNLQFTVVPEPSTFAMLLGGIGMLALLRKRRR